MSLNHTWMQSLRTATALSLALILGQASAATVSNTATASAQFGAASASATSNTVSINTLPAPTSSVIEFLRYAPGIPGSVVTPADGGSCQDSSGAFTPAPPIADAAGNSIDTASAPTLNTGTYHAGEPVFVRVADANRNIDPAVRDYVDARVTTSTADEEVLRLQETGINTGVFAGAIMSAATSPVRFDCRLSVNPESTLTAYYADTDFSSDTAQTSALVDPFGIVFDSTTGMPVNGATITLINALTGAPATIFGSDGTSTYPATVSSGATVTDSSGRTYALPPGGFVFPFVPSGDYRLVVTPPGSYAAPSTLPLAVLQGVRDSAGNPYAVGAGSFGDVFNLPLGPALNIDIPIDPLQGSLSLQKSASGSEVSAGDFLQYRLLLENRNAAGAATDARISDTLPPGMRYQNGSLHIAGQQAPDPATSADGRTLTILAGNVPAGGQVEMTYVVQVGAGTRAGQAVNSASATAGGGVSSNLAQVAVRIREPLFTSGFTLIGRVVEGECSPSPQPSPQRGEGVRESLPLPLAGEGGGEGLRSPPSQELKGVANVRMLLDDGTYVPTDRDGAFHFEGVRPGTHVVQLDVESLPPHLEAIPCAQNTRSAGRSYSQFVEAQGGTLWRADFYVRQKSAAATQSSHAPHEHQQSKRRAIPDDAFAAGGKTDWLSGQTPEIEWLFPTATHNPRAPTQRVVIKHAPNQKVVLKYEGTPVHPLNFDGVQTSADKTVSISIWRGLPLTEGDNHFAADVADERGTIVSTLTRAVHYANAPARAVLVPEESVLVADGIHEPVVAVRLLDRAGRPVRAGVTGPFRLDPPHAPAQAVELQQQRQLAGLDRSAPTYQVEGDDGVAYIELAPTTETGTAVLTFSFQQDERTTRNEEVRVWLEAEPRDWVVVGFASGTAGYDKLKGNMQALADNGEDEGRYTDGQVSLYAKGRVRGQWLLTLAYDSDQPAERNGRESLLSTIDPNEFYTLYGDGTAQRYDASSAEKLYLKLEREQFYALFGDYETGLTQTQLSRYSRTLTGVKGEYRGRIVSFTALASDTAQNFARDEIQGNGTSGLYRLSRGNIVINGEKIRIETRDRFRSEVIVESRGLRRHLDYDIDYSAGTLFFREPILSRDPDFNPNFIVAEYETLDAAEKELKAAGRVGAQFFDGALNAGVSYIRDEASLGKTSLGGVDVKLKLTPSTELRLEGATSNGRNATLARDGDAYLAEIEHHSRAFDALAYLRRQAPGFGVNQQNAAESGTLKAGVDAQLRLSEPVTLQAQTYRQENLVSHATRDVASAQLEYRADAWRAGVGTLLAQDEASSGEKFESRQMTLGANRYLFDKKLELSAQGDFSLGGRNDSVDYPTRSQFGAAYALSEDVSLIAAQEFTDGEAFDSSTTRVGLQVAPWQGARLTSTLNQSNISEHGPRTFGLLGLTQSFLVGERWGFDVSADTSRTFHGSGMPPLVINENQPIASGGVLDSGTLTEDFSALSAGATYRSELWSWTGRAEARNGEISDRYGLTTGFLRQLQAGIALAASAQAFQVDQAGASQGLLANASLSWAYRPLGRRWSALDRLEFRYDEVNDGTGLAGSGLFGATSLTVSGNAKSRRLINNFAVNRVSRAWSASDMQGNLFELTQRHQWSLYYGSKYVFDQFDGVDYRGYTDILGTEWRYDLTRKIDVGLRGDVLHVWDTHTYSYAVGPVIGCSPFDNAWISVGYNVRGFHDRDFESAHYTAQGPYLTLRFKFDQDSLQPGGATRD